MSTSPTTTTLLNPEPGRRVPEATLAYFRTRNKMRAFSLVHDELERSGISQAELAVRMGKSRTRICRLLGSPGNWTHDTESDLLFAISGAEIQRTASYPLDKPHRNQRRPEWLETAVVRSAPPSPRSSGTVDLTPLLMSPGYSVPVKAPADMNIAVQSA